MLGFFSNDPYREYMGLVALMILTKLKRFDSVWMLSGKNATIEEARNK